MLALRLRQYERAAVEALCDWGEHDADGATLLMSQHYAVFPGIADETAATDYNIHSPFPGTRMHLTCYFVSLVAVSKHAPSHDVHSQLQCRQWGQRRAYAFRERDESEPIHIV